VSGQTEVILPDELSEWSVEVIEGDSVRVILQLKRDGRTVADCGGSAAEVAGALAQAVEQATAWTEEQSR